MTTHAPHNTVEQPPDTHEMVVIHRAFRRESQLLASLIAAVPDGDIGRSRVLAAHLRWYHLGLQNHHHGEDELIWPLLHARLGTPADVLVRMEGQHACVAEMLDRLMPALLAWEASAGEQARERLVSELTSHRAVLLEHLDDEESQLLPLARRYLTQEEWNALGEHFVAVTPKKQLLIFLGAVLEDADPSERSKILSAMPLLPRLIWRSMGRTVYARHLHKVRGRPTMSPQS